MVKNSVTCHLWVPYTRPKSKTHAIFFLWIVDINEPVNVLISRSITSTTLPIVQKHFFQCCGSGSGSGSFYYQAKIVRKTLIPTDLWLLFDFISLKNDVNVPSKSNQQENFFSISFLLASWRSMTKIAGSGSGSGSISQKHGSADPDPDPHQNVMDQQHRFFLSLFPALAALSSIFSRRRSSAMLRISCSGDSHPWYTKENAILHIQREFHPSYPKRIPSFISKENSILHIQREFHPSYPKRILSFISQENSILHIQREFHPSYIRREFNPSYILRKFHTSYPKRILYFISKENSILHIQREFHPSYVKRIPSFISNENSILHFQREFYPSYPKRIPYFISKDKFILHIQSEFHPLYPKRIPSFISKENSILHIQRFPSFISK